MLAQLFRWPWFRRSPRERDRAQAAAQAVADGFPHLLLWADPSGSLRFLNRHYTTLTGHDRTLAIAGQSWRDRVHPDDRATLAAAFTRKAAPGAELHCEFRLLHRDGAFRWMLLAGRLGAAPGGEPVWYAGASDIHARVAAEQDLRTFKHDLQVRVAQKTADLIRTEARYASLFSVSRIAFAEQEMADAASILHALRQKGVTDLAAYMAEHPDVLRQCVTAVRTVSVNEACMRMLGFNDVKGAVDRPVERTAEDIETVLLRQFEMIFYDLENVEGRVVLIGEGGRRVPVFYSVIRLADERQLSSLVDVSSQERIEEMRRAAQEELARASRVATVGAFSSSIAHELNQPIASLSMDAETGLRFLERAQPDVQAAIRILTRVNNTTSRIAAIVKNTHDLITSGQQDLQPIDLHRLVTATCELLERDLRTVGIRLSIECADEVPRVMGNEVDLQQVVINLINNARDAMAGIAGDTASDRDIAVSLRADGAFAALSVADRGTGISEDDLDRLFLPFFTTKQGGIGLGLQICLSTIQRLGGDMKAANRPGGGAVFSFRLPAVAA